jgi:glycosyltransferase involved in cell wall biosynthesis
LYEGFGIPPLEALQFKCPSVVSQAGSMPEVLADSALYVSDPMNSEDWKDNIEKVLYSEQIKKQIVLKGTKRAQLFSWSKCAEQTHALYKKFSKNEK